MNEKMIRCLAIDDEPLALRQLSVYISKIPFLELAGSCQSAAEAKAKMDEDMVDALFIDINMPDLSGLDFVRSLSAPPMIVFTTAYSDYAVDGYKVDAIDYLLKPFGMDDMLRAANKLKRQYDLMHTAQVSSVDDDDALFLKTEYKVVRIKVADIAYIEGMSEYLRIYVGEQRKPIVVLLSMKKMEERLSGNDFMRVHRSYIINLKRIAEMNKSRIIMDNGTDIPIGDMYREAFTSYINKKFLGK